MREGETMYSATLINDPFGDRRVYVECIYRLQLPIVLLLEVHKTG